VLIVEDETHTRTVLQWLLEQCGAEVTATGSAEEGLAALEGGARFDVLVSDVALPGRDGYSLLRQLRKSPAGRQLPALALTAYTREEDRSRAREAGFEEYMAKPVEPQALVQAIAGLARLNARAGHPRHGG
jgi:CheY-like chemotaxis protein